MYYENYLAHHTKKNGIYFCNGVPVSKGGLKKALKNATPEERKKIQDTVEKEKLKKELIRHPKKLYEHKDDFTKEEITEIISEINWDQSIKDVSRSEHDRNVARLKSVLSNTATVTKHVYDIYNNFNNLKKLFNGDSGDSKDKKSSDSGDKKSGDSGDKKSGNSGNSDDKKPSEDRRKKPGGN